MFRKNLKLIFVMLLLSFSLSISLYAQNENDILKVGLFYGANGLPAAKLQNVSGYGYGYKIGYFDTNKSFQPLFEVGESKLTIVKDKLIYIDSNGEYYDVAPQSYSKVIAPYHLQLNESYTTIEELNAAVSDLKKYGLSVFPAYIDGKYAVRVGAYETNAAAMSAMSDVASTTQRSFSVAGYSNTCYTVTITDTDTILFEFDSGSLPIGIMPKPSNGEKTQTWFKGYKYYGGFEYNRVNGNDITVISVVSVNDYIKGVLPYEMSASWNIEALKVQALCAKSYAYNSMGKHKSQGFDLCNTTDCQVYKGTNLSNANSDAAVEAVMGKYVLYDGKVAQTYYHASSGGHTEDVENIWGNYVPYLRGVPDDYLKYVKSGYESWTYTVTLPMITNILKSKNYDVTEITDYYVSKYSTYGNAIQVTFVDKVNGKRVVSGEKARTILNSSEYNVYTKSHRYTISQRGGIYVGNKEVTNGIYDLFAIGKELVKKALTGNFSTIKVLTKNGIENINASTDKSQYIIQGSGSGHNIGMSQWGARGMAEQGFTYDAIVKHYFTGVTIGNVN